MIPNNTGELGYDGPLYDRFLHMTEFAYDGPIFLVPLNLSYPSSPVIVMHNTLLGGIKRPLVYMTLTNFPPSYRSVLMLLVLAKSTIYELNDRGTTFLSV